MIKVKCKLDIEEANVPFEELGLTEEQWNDLSIDEQGMKLEQWLKESHYAPEPYIYNWK